MAIAAEVHLCLNWNVFVFLNCTELFKHNFSHTISDTASLPPLQLCISATNKQAGDKLMRWISSVDRSVFGSTSTGAVQKAKTSGWRVVTHKPASVRRGQDQKYATLASRKRVACMFTCMLRLQLLMTDECKDRRNRQQLFNTNSSFDLYFFKGK